MLARERERERRREKRREEKKREERREKRKEKREKRKERSPLLDLCYQLSLSCLLHIAFMERYRS